MEFSTNPTRYRFMVNDTKKQIFQIPLNLAIPKDAPEEVKNTDPGIYALFYTSEIYNTMCKQNKWYTDEIVKKINENDINLDEYKDKGYTLKVWDENVESDTRYIRVVF
jgi:hypothetical protein